MKSFWRLQQRVSTYFRTLSKEEIYFLTHLGEEAAKETSLHTWLLQTAN